MCNWECQEHLVNSTQIITDNRKQMSGWGQLSRHWFFCARSFCLGLAYAPSSYLILWLCMLAVLITDNKLSVCFDCACLTRYFTFTFICPLNQTILLRQFNNLWIFSIIWQFVIIYVDRIQCRGNPSPRTKSEHGFIRVRSVRGVLLLQPGSLPPSERGEYREIIIVEVRTHLFELGRIYEKQTN